MITQNDRVFKLAQGRIFDTLCNGVTIETIVEIKGYSYQHSCVMLNKCRKSLNKTKKAYVDLSELAKFFGQTEEQLVYEYIRRNSAKYFEELDNQ